ncbi:MAG: M15 family metallopeptidase [Ignavibacteria bacterium]
MKINDYLLCTFEDDNEIPKNTYVAKILDVDTTNSKLDCEFVDTKQRIKFEFNLSGIWPGIDLLDGTNYGIDTHDIYSPTASSPVAEQVALVTFSDNAQYLCYVESIEDNTNVQFYHQPYPRIRISIDNQIIFSDWDQYPLGEQIISIEACYLNEEIPSPTIIDTPDSTADWPARPDFIRQYSDKEREFKFGKFRFVPAPEESDGDGIKILDNWEHENIVRVELPVLYLNGIIRGSTKKAYVEKNCALEFHKNGADNFKQLWKDWEDAGLIDRIIDCSLPFVPRYIRGTQGRNPRPLSNHSWGTAFDINVAWNKLGKVPALLNQKGSVRELVALANKNGFFWGGHFGGGRMDGMHFELGKML